MSATAIALETRPLHPNLGIEILGLDLSKPLDDATRDAIKALWERHFVLLLRKQSLTEAEQVAFTKRFGDLAVYGEPDKRSTAHPEIVRISNVGEDGIQLLPDSPIRRFFATLTALWHTDGSYKAVPSLGSALHALEVPPKGGETCFANTVLAYEQLPEAMQRRLAGKHMVHDHDFTRILAEGQPPSTPEQRRALPPACHPVVRTHADGRKSLFISSNVAYYVGGMPLEEGKALHRELFDWVSQPQFVYCHAWQPGDLLLWDNRFVLHRVTPFDERRHRRVMQRTELVGTEIPV